jgi:amidophosphoribosyltransferase
MNKFFKFKPHDHCGVFAIFAPKEDVARLTYFGLLSLQHRGQESAGIAVSSQKKLTALKGMGLVNQIFTEAKIKKLKGKMAVGHTRYSTEGSSTLNNAQPVVLATRFGSLALAHNGNLANYKNLKTSLFTKGHCFNSEVDSELIARTIINAKGKSLKQKIKDGIADIKGAFSLVLLNKNKLYVIRDQWGIRPLVLGKINSTGYIAASESCAIESIGGQVLREVKPGECLEIGEKGFETFYQIKNKKGGFCIFEYIYFARPDSILNNKLVHQVRFRSGKILAIESPVKADMVCSVPDSGTSAALGYSQQSQIPFQEGLIKSRYVGRTFIQPSKRIRDLGVRLKFSPLGQVIKNKTIVLVDDSIVRGTTIAQIIVMLKKAGVKKIHLRIASPPFKHICYLGVDVKRYNELIASQLSVEQIRKKIKADSLSYLSLKGLKTAIGKADCRFCTGCFNQKYPI